MITNFNDNPSQNTTKKGFSKFAIAKPLIIFGAGGENRTRMSISPEDFESSASTNFTTPALRCFYK